MSVVLNRPATITSIRDNAICAQTGQARTSKTPGRTQLLNVFALDDGHRLIDLPGYGYAKVPEEMREHWRKLIDQSQALRGGQRSAFLRQVKGEQKQCGQLRGKCLG